VRQGEGIGWKHSSSPIFWGPVSALLFSLLEVLTAFLSHDVVSLWVHPISLALSFRRGGGVFVFVFAERADGAAQATGSVHAALLYGSRRMRVLFLRFLSTWICCGLITAEAVLRWRSSIWIWQYPSFSVE
jgi:hypothetical protein